ncbi:sina homologue [Carabus blaptoides fortunei]
MAEIDTKVLENLKCSVCECYLSVSPIMQKANGDSVCGRCVIADNIDHSTLRMKAYELLASTHMFPCRYNKDGCRTKLHWEDVRVHEEDCSYRPYECFMLPPAGCTWTGCRNQLIQHFTKDHANNFIKMSQETEIDVSEDFETNMLTTVFNLLFLVQIKYSKGANKMWHSVRYVGNAKCSMLFKYSLTVISEEEDLVKKRDVEPANTLYPSNDKSHEICFEECLKVAIKVKIDKKFIPKIGTRMQCTLCKKCLSLSYTCQTKDGCYCTECAPDNYVIIYTGSSTVSCEDCHVKESLDGMKRHLKWFCNSTHIRYESNLAYYEKTTKDVISRSGLTWKSQIFAENTDEFQLIGKLNDFFFIFAQMRDTELCVQIVSHMKANEVELFGCEMKVTNPETNYSVQTISKKGEDCDWESHFNWSLQKSLIDKRISNGKLKSFYCLEVTIKKVV